MKRIVKHIIYLLIIAMISPACVFFGDFEADVPQSFYIDINESDLLVNAERNNIITIGLFAENGISKAELRRNFETIEGSEQTYNGEKEADYIFEINPEAAAIGEYISYTVVLFDMSGEAVTCEMQLSVQKAPSTVTILVPPTAPENLNYDDSVYFQVPFTSPTPLSLIKITLGDSVLLEKTSGFQTPESDIVLLSYNEFNILPPGTNATFDFNIIGVAPIEDDEQGRYDTALVVYSVYVTGPRVPQPIRSYDNITMGFQGNTEPTQFMDFETGNLYGYVLEPFGYEVSELIDFAVYRSSSNGLCITNPTDAAAAEFIYLLPTYGFAEWMTLNKTGFVKVTDGSITLSDFENADSDSLFYEAYRTADLIGDTFKKLEANEMVVFKTVNDKYGAILFHSYVNQATGSVTLSVKVQE